MVSDPLYGHQFGVPFGQLHFGPIVMSCCFAQNQEVQQFEVVIDQEFGWKGAQQHQQQTHQPEDRRHMAKDHLESCHRNLQ